MILKKKKDLHCHIPGKLSVITAGKVNWAWIRTSACLQTFQNSEIGPPAKRLHALDLDNNRVYCKLKIF